MGTCGKILLTTKGGLSHCNDISSAKKVFIHGRSSPKTYVYFVIAIVVDPLIFFYGCSKNTLPSFAARLA